MRAATLIKRTFIGVIGACGLAVGLPTVGHAEDGWSTETKPSEKPAENVAIPDAPAKSAAAAEAKPSLPVWTAPPMKKGEFVVKTKNGCGLVFTSSATITKAHMAKSYADYTWQGLCADGLAMGAGLMTPTPARVAEDRGKGASAEAIEKASKTEVWFWWGRSAIKNKGADNYSHSYMAIFDGKVVIAPASMSLSNPVWGNSNNDQQVDDGTRKVRATERGCQGDNRLSFAPCSSGRWYDETIFYGVIVSTSDLQSSVVHPCPDATSSAGCQALWEKHAGPVFKNVKQVINTIDQRKAEASRIAKDWPDFVKRRKAAAEQAAADKATAAAEAQKVAEVQAAADAAKQQQLAALKAEADVAAGDARAKADADFTASLAGQDAGKLFVLADKLKRDGQIERARVVLHEILEKHASHAMAAPAAQALTTLDSAPVKPAGVAGGAMSACVRNGKKLDAFVVDLKKSSGEIPEGDGALVTLHTHEARMKVYAPCTEKDATARAEFERSLNLKTKAQQKCAAAGEGACARALAGAGKQWVDAVNGEVSKALSDPLYSAGFAGTAARAE